MKLNALLHVVAATTRPIIGGQAVVEGVMMRSPKSLAVAVRQPDGTIAVREQGWLSFAERWPVLKLPILRGANMLIESMVNGIQALNWSAATAFPEDKRATEESQKGNRGMTLAIIVSLGFAFLLFKGVPHMSAWAIGQYFGFDAQSPVFHLVDGAVKMAVFAGYITLLGTQKELRRLFIYHGAEHKSVHVWEANEPLDVEHARPKSTAHPRCGTSLILLVFAVSILVFAAVLPFVPKVFDNELAQTAFLLVLKAPLLLPIAGLAYEAQRLAAKNPGNVVVRVLIAPGMLFQRLTTREPGDRELEVALAALRKTVWREKQSSSFSSDSNGNAGGNGDRADVVPIKTAANVEVFTDFDAVAKQVA